MKKVLVLVTHFAPYRDDTFKRIAETGKYTLKFLIGEGNTIHTEWQYADPDFDFETTEKIYSFKKFGVLYKGYLRLLKEYKPDTVVLFGNFISILLAKMFFPKVKVVFYADTMRFGKNAESKLNYFLLSKIYGLCDGIWTCGSAGEKYFRYYVGDKVPIRHGCYTNDVHRILNKIALVDRAQQREKLGVKENESLFLFVGKLIPSRHVERILASAAVLEEKGSNVKILIIGDGADAGKVNDYLKKHSNVLYIPSVPISELEQYYAAADAYTHLGWEPFSLALYEAAIAGLPIVANADIGACYECVKNGENGYLFWEFDAEAVADEMMEIAAGKYKSGAAAMAETIKQTRGTPWAANQLMEIL